MQAKPQIRNYAIRISRFLICVLVTILFSLQTVGSLKFPIVDRIDNILYDLRLSATVPNTRDPRIIILDVDEKSLASEGRWPWHRDKLSYLTDILFDYYKVKLLAFDVVFPERDESLEFKVVEKLLSRIIDNEKVRLGAIENLYSLTGNDQLFADSIRGRPVVLGYFTSHKKTDSNPGALPHPLVSAERLPFARHLFMAESYGGNLQELQSASGSGGFFNNPFVDEDGSYRRLPLLVQYQNNLYEALPLAILRNLLNISEIDYEVGDGYGADEGDVRLEALRLDPFRIPVDETGSILIPYRGKQRSFAYISVVDVLNGTVERNRLADKIVIVGTTAAGLFDLHPTPVQNRYPGVEIHANVVSGILDQAIKSRPPFIMGWELLQLVLIAAIAILLFPLFSAGIMTLVFLGMLLLVTLGNFLVWTSLDIESNLTAAVLLLFAVYIIQMFFGYFFEARKKRRLGQIFGQYIPPELVEEMSQSEAQFTLKGESRQLTVLFSDVRGFTSLSEKLDPEELCRLVNEILNPITRVIHANKGTIDKYMGDAVMAFWGAPLTDPDHASGAVRAGLSILPALEGVQQDFAQRGWPPIKMGIGINTGSMSVGNMGSEFRMAYTVMGDAVNLGSRLEGLTKQYGVNIIVSESTKRAASEFLYRELDQVRVKGKLEPITIYEPIVAKEEAGGAYLEELKRLEQALDHYRAKRWGEAELLFEGLAADVPGCMPYRIYLERIAHFRKYPPPADWDGVFVHTA